MTVSGGWWNSGDSNSMELLWERQAAMVAASARSSKGECGSSKRARAAGQTETATHRLADGDGDEAVAAVRLRLDGGWITEWRRRWGKGGHLTGDSVSGKEPEDGFNGGGGLSSTPASSSDVTATSLAMELGQQKRQGEGRAMRGCPGAFMASGGVLGTDTERRWQRVRVAHACASVVTMALANRWARVVRR